MKLLVLLLGLSISTGIFAFESFEDKGGVHCSQCPAETSKCTPLPDCCPSNSSDNCDGATVGAACGSEEGTCRVAPKTYSCFCSPNFLE